MADHMIVATFRERNAAYDAISAAKKLEDDEAAGFKARAGVMVGKDDKGNVHILEKDKGVPWGVAVGPATGALIGLVGGATGAAVGAALGAALGIPSDAILDGLDHEFVKDVEKDMRPGTTAVIVEAEEGSEVPLDLIVERYGGRVHRQDVVH